MVLALATLGTACQKASPKKIIGQWNLLDMRYRDINNPDWQKKISDEDNVTVSFTDNGTFSMYKDNVLQTSGRWEYKDGILYLYSEISGNVAYTVEKCTKTYMEWFYKNEKWVDGEQTFWEEEYYTWVR